MNKAQFQPFGLLNQEEQQNLVKKLSDLLKQNQLEFIPINIIRQISYDIMNDEMDDQSYLNISKTLSFQFKNQVEKFNKQAQIILNNIENQVLLNLKQSIGDIIENITSIYQIENKEEILLQLDNRVTVIDFWMSWCSPSLIPINKNVQLNNQFGDKIRFISICLDEDMSNVQKIIEENNWKNLENYVADIQIKKFYGVIGVPHKIIINKHKQIVYSGNSSHRNIEDDLQYVLNDKQLSGKGAEVETNSKKPQMSSINPKNVLLEIEEFKKTVPSLFEDSLIQNYREAIFQAHCILNFESIYDVQKESFNYIYVNYRDVQTEDEELTESIKVLIDSIVKGQFKVIDC